MPITKTAKRALRSSKRKEAVNKKLTARYEVALRRAQKSPSSETVRKAISLVDKMAKKNLVHKNKAARIKSKLSKLAKPAGGKTSSKKGGSKKSSSKSKRTSKSKKSK